MIFGQNSVLQDEVAIGVGFFTVSTFVGGIVFGRLSSYSGMIAGPDITPAVRTGSTRMIGRVLASEPCPANPAVPGIHGGDMCDPLRLYLPRWHGRLRLRLQFRLQFRL